MRSSKIIVLATAIILSATMCTSVANKNKKEVQARSESGEEAKPKYEREGNYEWRIT